MKTMKLAVAAGALFVGLHVFAQVPSTEISAEQKAAVKEMMAAINLKQQMAQMGAAMSQSMPQMIQQMTAQTTRKLSPEAQAKAREQASKSMQASFPKLLAMYADPEVVQGMEDIMGRAYAKRFTLAEVKSVTAFFTSEAGKKMISAAPQIMQDTMPEIMALMSPRMKAFAEGIVKEAAGKAAENAPVAK